MRHLTRIFESEDNRPVVSYDFDGCLHRSVFRGHPVPDFNTWDKYTPFTEMHDQMREDAKENRIIVVTARPEHLFFKVPVERFIEKHDLPVDEVICTDNGSKREALEEAGAWRHYDDMPHVANELKDTDIECILVDPKSDETAGLLDVVYWGDERVSSGDIKPGDPLQMAEYSDPDTKGDKVASRMVLDVSGCKPYDTEQKIIALVDRSYHKNRGISLQAKTKLDRLGLDVSINDQLEIQTIALGKNTKAKLRDA